MGTTSSRRMDNSDDEAFSHEADVATFLQLLIRSGGHVEISSFSDVDDTTDDEFVNPASIPRFTVVPDTKDLEKSEISLITRQQCGLEKPLPDRQFTSPTSMLAARERGLCGKYGFSQSTCCRISNCYLPNTMRVVEDFGQKGFCGTYTEDGNTFLSASQDRKLRLYDTSNGHFKLTKTILARDVGWSILDTAFSPDGRFIAYSSWSECLYLYRLYGEDVEQQEPLCLYPGERRFCIFSVVFSADGYEILGGANDGFIYIYDQNTHQRTLRIQGHADDVNAVAFADNSSQILYSGGDDGILKVWDRRTLNETDPNPVGCLVGHFDGITFIDPKGDNRHLITNSKDQTLKLWDMRIFSPIAADVAAERIVGGQNWDYRWQKAPKKITSSRKPLEGDTSVMTYRGHSVLQTLIRCRFSPAFTTGQRYIYTGCASGRVVIYDVLTGKMERGMRKQRACVRDVFWHPYKPEIVSTSWDGTLGLWTYSENPADTEMMISTQVLRRSQRLAEKTQRQTNESD